MELKEERKKVAYCNNVKVFLPPQLSVFWVGQGNSNNCVCGKCIFMFAQKLS